MYQNGRDVLRASGEAQSLHDAVIAVAAAHIESDGYVVETNPGPEKNRSIAKGQWPDIVASSTNESRTKPILEWVFEVETADSVTREQAVNQWAGYAETAAALAARFALIVPFESIAQAKALLHEYGIEGPLFYFEHVKGKVTVSLDDQR
jgi:hypothetical protein